MGTKVGIICELGNLLMGGLRGLGRLGGLGQVGQVGQVGEVGEGEGEQKGRL